MTVNVKINYPILAFPKGYVLAYEKEELDICNKTALKNGFYENLYLIDSKLNKFTVYKTKPLRGVPPFWGFRITQSRVIEIDLQLVPLETPSMTEVRETTIQLINKNRSFWAAGWNIKELESLIRKAESIPEIVDILNE